MISSSAIHCLSRPARSFRVPAGLFKRARLVCGGGLASDFRRYSTASAALVCDAIVGFETLVMHRAADTWSWPSCGRPRAWVKERRERQRGLRRLPIEEFDEFRNDLIRRFFHEPVPGITNDHAFDIRCH